MSVPAAYLCRTYPKQIGIEPLTMDWGNPDPLKRGPVVVSRSPSTIGRRNGLSKINPARDATTVRADKAEPPTSHWRWVVTWNSSEGLVLTCLPAQWVPCGVADHRAELTKVPQRRLILHLLRTGRCQQGVGRWPQVCLNSWALAPSSWGVWSVVC